jgi:VanZ family protein
MSKWLVQTAFGRMLVRLLPRITDRGAEIDLRKYAHMAEYAMLAVPSALFFRELLLQRRVPLRALGCSLVFCFLYACSDEYHQTFIPGRAGAMIDVAVDMAGVAFGLVLVLLACMRRKELK